MLYISHSTSLPLAAPGTTVYNSMVLAYNLQPILLLPMTLCNRMQAKLMSVLKELKQLRQERLLTTSKAALADNVSLLSCAVARYAVGNSSSWLC